MINIFAVVGVTLGLTVSSTQHQAIDEFCDANIRINSDQANVLVTSYEFGKEYGLETVLPAIAWRESNLGKYLMNINDPSFGPYAIHIDTATSRLGIDRESFMANVLAQDLVMDQGLGARLAINEINYWLRIRGGNHPMALASYNAGFVYRRGLEYSEDVTQKAGLIKLCITRIKNRFNLVSKKPECTSRFCSLLEMQ